MRIIPFITAATIVAASSPAAAASHHAWDQASSIGRDALVVVALGFPAVQGDWNGDAQAALSMGAAFGATQILKHTIHEERPDNSDNQSFPSGHTSVSFAAAASLEKRYGWQVGLPAHLVAAFVGVARVGAKKHFVHDVVAGAVIGEASGWLLTRRKDDRVRWLPWGDAHGGGATFAMRF
ncbi:phosphatase PAP2 family protein [Sphingomonas ginkgonis]|uniref:Phosphatase PAP2 family protein n=1 Tax=Sphingomonas ginkgonis TaxID=2315330 RepID=A0A3R9YNX1_9SPHN|nr:phosphatase PAP2 family protein [Sphingomonas ginkgonis]RST31793.1 phosphatase PAP2 family protein [Sphingomonas ginkgonis]